LTAQIRFAAEGRLAQLGHAFTIFVREQEDDGHYTVAMERIEWLVATLAVVALVGAVNFCPPCAFRSFLDGLAWLL
jgi:hypothetical protein